MRGILGADVFINLLLVFIITTGLLLMNTNKTGKIGDIVKKEQTLLKIDLPKGSSKGLPGGKPGNMATLSARKTGEGIQHFMDDKPVMFTDLTKILKSKRISSVRIRFDRQISYGHYVSVLDLCKQAGIKDITNVYTTNK